MNLESKTFILKKVPVKGWVTKHGNHSRNKAPPNQERWGRIALPDLVAKDVVLFSTEPYPFSEVKDSRVSKSSNFIF